MDMYNPQFGVDSYLLAFCATIIDEFNEKYRNVPKEELKKMADIEFSEDDIKFRIGKLFLSTVHFGVYDCNHSEKSIHDIYVKARDFYIEIKYLRNSISKGAV